MNERLVNQQLEKGAAPVDCPRHHVTASHYLGHLHGAIKVSWKRDARDGDIKEAALDGAPAS